MQKDTLYLGSQSKARHRLLSSAQINYEILCHGSDEELTDKPINFHDYVLAIAIHKMQTLSLPEPTTITTDYLYVLTADTLMRSPSDGYIFGKPKNRSQAIHMLNVQSQLPVEVVTGCCLEKFKVEEDGWTRIDFEHWTTSAIIEFCVNSDAIEQYLQTFPFVLECSGATAVEDQGLAYLKSIQGSYTAVIGLPLYELRLALKKLGFKF